MSSSSGTRVFAYLALTVLLLLGMTGQGAYAQASKGYSTYFIMGEEEDFFTAFSTTNNNNNTTRPAISYVAIVSSSDNVQIFLDEHENGYAADPILNPDAKWVIGGSPGPLMRGQVLILRQTDLYCAGSTGVDGGDKLVITGSPVTVVRIVFFNPPGAVHAASFEMYPTSEWQTTYTVPIGQDISGSSFTPPVYGHAGNNGPSSGWVINDPFKYTFLFISGKVQGTTYTVTRPSLSTVNGTLNDVTGVGLNAMVPNITAGSQLTAGQPVQAGIFTSHKWSQWDQRFYTLTPEDLLGQEYHIPLPSMRFPPSPPEQSSHGSEPIDTGSYVYAFENNTTVTIDTAGVSTNVTMNAGQVIRVRMPRNANTYNQKFGTDPYPPPTSVIKFSGNGVIKADKKIWVLTACDDGDNGVDWGFPAINNELLGTEIYVPWGRGNPVHVTPLYDNTDFFVDWYPQDGVVDLTFTLNNQDTYMIYPNVYQSSPHPLTGANYDATGARIWATNKFVAVFGQDFSEKTPGEQALSVGIDSDFGHVLPPMRFTEPVLSIQKTLSDGFHPTNPVTPETEIFTIVLATDAFDVYNAAITDHLPPGWEFDPSFDVAIDLSWDAAPAYSHATGLDPVETVNSSNLTGGNKLVWDLSTYIPTYLPTGADHLPPNSTITLVYQAKTKSGATFSSPQATPVVGFGTTNYSPGDNRYHEFYPTDNVWIYYGNQEPPQLDFGDAPASYGTALAGNGARHGIKPNFQLGAYLDPEADGVPSLGALSDDQNQTNNDEDGVTFTSYPLSGQGSQQTVNLTVNAQVTGLAKLHAWYDFNGDGDFDDTVNGVSEKIFSNQTLVNGNNALSFTAPANLTEINTYARFRLSSGVFLNPTGIAVDGEVEDYFLPIGYDWGDAPDATNGTGAGNYQTRNADNGPRHRVSTLLTLGALVDIEPDGQQNGTATGDDQSYLDDDEGVVMPATITVGSAPIVPVTVRNRKSATAYLYGWIDYNRNGLFESGERANATIPANSTVVVNLTFPTVPGGSTSGSTYARFRLSTNQTQAQSPTGAADDGEVEDYMTEIDADSYDWGDLNDTSGGTGAGDYQTLAANNGPRHQLGSNLRMGVYVDAETNALANANANGDDNDPIGGPNDEDGVTLPSTTSPNSTLQVTVAVINPTASTAHVYGWIDFDNNGAFNNTNERASGTLAANSSGNVVLTFNVPSGAAIATVGARFRIGTVQSEVENSTGAAADGEVEDHLITISNADNGTFDFGDAPVSYGVAFERKLDNSRRMAYLGPYEAAEADRLKHVDGDNTVNTAPNPDFRGAGALGDDQDGNDDEDGVMVVGGMVGEPGKPMTMLVTTSRQNLVQIFVTGWMDWNISGAFDGSSEQIFQATHGTGSAASDEKLHTFTITVPAGAALGTSYLRVRAHDNLWTGWGPTGGSGSDNEAGEVEDYVFILQEVSTYDYGDAPASYGAAGHVVGTKAPRMGHAVDGEVNPLYSNDAHGDNTLDLFDDETGVDMPAVLSGGSTPSITVNVQNEAGGTAYIVGWIDYDGNGVFDPSERSTIATRTGTGSGNVTLTFPAVPSVKRSTFARFRISTDATWGASPLPTGMLSDGEAEDYPVEIEGPISVTLTSFKAVLAKGTVYLSWTVENEIGVAGYNVLRSAGENGAYEKVNNALISAGQLKRYEFTDQPPTVNVYYYKLQEIGLGGDTAMHGPIVVDLLTGVVGDKLVIEAYTLYSNYPNPFNPTTTLSYDLPKDSYVSLTIYDMNGRLVKELVGGHQAMGRYNIHWDATDQFGDKVSSGVYFYRLNAGDFNATAKMLLLK